MGAKSALWARCAGVFCSLPPDASPAPIAVQVFLEFGSEAEARRAVAAYDGASLLGRQLRVAMISANQRDTELRFAEECGGARRRRLGFHERGKVQSPALLQYQQQSASAPAAAAASASAGGMEAARQFRQSQPVAGMSKLVAVPPDIRRVGEWVVAPPLSENRNIRGTHVTLSADTACVSGSGYGQVAKVSTTSRPSERMAVHFSAAVPVVRGRKPPKKNGLAVTSVAVPLNPGGHDKRLESDV